MERGNISPDELYPVDIRLTVWFDLVNLATFSCFAKNVLPHVIFMCTILNNKIRIYVCFDDVSEWLRSVTRNHMGSARTGSSPVVVALKIKFFFLTLRVFKGEHVIVCDNKIISDRYYFITLSV